MGLPAGGIHRLRSITLSAGYPQVVLGAVTGAAQGLFRGWLYPPPPPSFSVQKVLLRARARAGRILNGERWLEGYGGEGWLEHLSKRALGFYAPPLGAWLAFAVMAMLGGLVAPWAVFPGAVALLGLEWLARWLLEPGPELTLVRSVTAACAPGMILAWLLGEGSSIGVLLALASMLIVLVAAWTIYGALAGDRSMGGELPMSEPSDEQDVVYDRSIRLQRMLANWRWHQATVRLRRSAIRYVDCVDGIDRMEIIIHPSISPAHVGRSARWFDAILRRPVGTCFISQDPERADRFWLEVPRPDAKRDLIDRLAKGADRSISEEVVAEGPSLDDHLTALFQAAPNQTLRFGIVKDAAEQVGRGRTTAFEWVREHCDRAGHGQWRLRPRREV